MLQIDNSQYQGNKDLLVLSTFMLLLEMAFLI